MSNRTSSHELVPTADTLGAFASAWIAAVGTWRVRGSEGLRTTYYGASLGPCDSDAQVRFLVPPPTWSGPANRRHIVPLAYPHSMPATHALSALSTLIRMHSASFSVNRKLTLVGASITDSEVTTRVITALVTGTRAGCIEAFNCMPTGENSDRAARYSMRWSARTARLALNNAGSDAAEDLWIAALKASPVVSAESTLIALAGTVVGPFILLAYSYLQRGDGNSVMGDIMIDIAWAKILPTLEAVGVSLDADATAVVRAAMLYETGAPFPARLVATVSADPAVGVWVRRRLLDDAAAILVSREQEEHLRRSATVERHPVSVQPPDRVRLPSPNGSESDSPPGTVVSHVMELPERTPMAAPLALAPATPTFLRTSFDDRRGSTMSTPMLFTTPQREQVRQIAQHAAINVDPTSPVARGVSPPAF